VKSDRNVKRLMSAIDNQRRVPLGKDHVREFVLYKSTLTDQAPVYEVLAAFPLKP
jgi:2'-5' RNA ligase